MADYSCPARTPKTWPAAKQTTTVGSAEWNVPVDAVMVSRLFRALEMLNRQSKPFEVYRIKLRSLKPLLFQDEYNTLMCGIDSLEEDVTQFLAHVYESNEFMELISGQVRKIGTVLDLADAIREMDKRVSEFRRIYDAKIADLLSATQIRARNLRCEGYRPSCSPLSGKGETYIPCAMIKAKGFMKQAKCRYSQWTGDDDA